MKNTLIFLIFCFISTEAYSQRYVSMYNNGLKKFRQKDYRGAVLEFQKAINYSEGEYSPAFTGQGMAYEMLGNKSAAMGGYNSAIRINQNDAMAYNLRGMLKCRMGKYKEGIEDFTKIINMNPKYAQKIKGKALFQRGRAKYEIDNKKGGCSDMKRAYDVGYEKAYSEYISLCN